MARERLARFGERVRLARADLANMGQVGALDTPTCTAAIAVQALQRPAPRAGRWIYNSTHRSVLATMIFHYSITAGNVIPAVITAAVR